ncbi:Ig-like domain-containing protein [Candidatus Palauibacter sp.]|uniref:Ig-like domain-containing protein n=1 Tax=Candidatus Palauibacter sp. TaxID=3101350 RepID=UPI003B5C12FF
MIHRPGTVGGAATRKRSRHGWGLAVVVSVAAALSCGEDAVAPPSPPTEPGRPTSISISPSVLRFEALGDTARLVAEVRDRNGEVVRSARVTWESGDPSVATVDATGLATAVRNGTASIAAAAEGASGTAEVTVDQVVAALEVSPSSVDLALEDSLRLRVEAADANGHPVTDFGLVWRSTDESIATVDATGLVIGVGIGMATIRATSGAASADAGVEVLSGADADRLVLTTLFDVTDGAGWIHDENWLTDLPLADWHGVGVDDEGRVTELDLEANNLVGPIPVELSRLKRLRELNLIRNSLRGRIPPELGTLAHLEVLGLGINQLTGPLPPELGQLSRLRELHVYRNPLSGRIRGELANLDRLEKFVLYWTDIAGPVPQAFLRLERLKEVAALRTPVCVPGTAAFARWTEDIRIVEFEAHCNRRDVAVLTGLYRTTGGEDWHRSGGWGAGSVLEDWHGVGADSLGRAVALDLAGNGLAGRLPASLGELTRLTELRLGGNALTGPLPLALSKLPLREFHYVGTELCVPADERFQDWLRGLASHDGPGAQCSLTSREILETLYYATDGPSWKRNDNWLTNEPLGSWHGVEANTTGVVLRLDLPENGLAGEIPAEIGRFSALRVLDLGDNALRGSIPSDLGGLASLRQLLIGGNRLEGEIPPELGNLAALRQLVLEGNQLRGPIPAELGNLATLRTFDLSSNRLTGSIPSGLGRLSALTGLGLANNRLSGPIPAELGSLANLGWLSLWGNDLSGPVPAELGGLRNVSALWLSGNELTGPIPAEFGDLANLTNLWLNDNELSGSIPSELGSLANLRQFRAGSNELRGPIPRELGNLAALEHLFLGSNALTGPIPQELGSLASLTWLDLSANRFSGELPGELGELEKLNGLILNDNPGLAGPVPLSFGRLGSVGVFLAGGTDLCAPADAALLAWLEGRPQRRLARCIEAGEAESAAYLIQAIQSRTHPVPLIADDPALLRVFVAAAGAGGATMPAVRARFYHGGEEVHRVDIPTATAEIPVAVDESSLDLSSNEEVPGWVIQPGLEMVVEIDPDGALDPVLGVPKRIPAEGRSRVDVLAMPPLDLTVVPMLWSVVPDSSILDITEGLSTDGELLGPVGSLLPVGEFSVTVHDPVVTESRSTLDLLVETLVIRRLEGETGYYLGTMAEPSVSVGVAYNGYPVAFGAPDRHTFVHELGHNMSLRHAPCGGAGGADPAFPHAEGSSGAWGYDFERRELVDPSIPDLMGYCEPNWISDYFFTHAAQFRRYYERAGTRAAARTRTLLLWGGIEPDGAPFLEPAFVVAAPVAAPTSGGAYELRGTAGDGRVLFSTSFEMPEVAHGEGGSRFAFALPVEREWGDALAKVTLSGPGGTATLDAETDAPLAIVRDLSSGQVRGILRGPLMGGFARASVSNLLSDPGIEVLVSRGLPAREAWRR